MAKTMMVTGATKNTGYAIAKRFLKQGYDVCITSRSQQSADEAAEKLHAMYPGQTVLPMRMDPGKVEDIESAFKIVEEKFGHLDAFVDNAVDMAKKFHTMNVTPEYWDSVMNVNVRGYFFCAQAAARLMPDGGSIVMMGSIHAHQAVTSKVCYSASKGAIVGMMHAMAVELGHRGIRVNVLTAGAIWCEPFWTDMTEEQRQQKRDFYPAGRESKEDEIAGGVWYLCSDEAKTITGTELTIDSGISVCLLPYDKHWEEKWDAAHAEKDNGTKA